MHSENQRSFLALMSMLSLSSSCLISRDTLPQSSGGEPGTIAVSAETHLSSASEWDFKAARRMTRGSGTCVSNNLLPRLIGDNVEQQGGDEGCEGPQPHCAVSAAAGHGEGTTLVAG